MKRKLYNRNKIWYFIILMFSLLIGYGTAIPNILSVLIFILWLFELIKGNLIITKGDILLFLMFNGHFLFQMVSLIWSNDIEYGLDKILLQSQIPLLFLVFISLRNTLSQKQVINIIQAYTVSIVILLIISFIYSFDISNPNLESVSGNNLAESFVDLYFLGFSLYLAVGLILSIHVYIHNQNMIFKLYKKSFLFLVFLSVIGLILLGSRMVIVVTFIITVYQSIIFLLKKNKTKLYLKLMGFFTIIIISLSLNQNLTNKFKEAINYKNQYQITENWGGRAFRELIWNCSLHVFNENIIAGTGVGDQQNELTLCYKKYRYQPLLYFQKSFNAHSIFLQQLVSTGIFGFILLCISFVIPVIIAKNKKQFLYILFVLLFFITGLTETHFLRNVTVLLFAFFNPFLYFLLNEQNENFTST